jgi:hypothetical protein
MAIASAAHMRQEEGGTKGNKSNPGIVGDYSSHSVIHSKCSTLEETC